MNIKHSILQDVFYTLDSYTSSWRGWCPRFLLSRYYSQNWHTLHNLKTQLKNIHIFSFQSPKEVMNRYKPLIEIALEKHLNQHVLKTPAMAEHYTRIMHLGKTTECLLSAYCSLAPNDAERRVLINHVTHLSAFKRLKQSHPGIASKVLYRLYGSLGLSFDEYLRKVKYQAGTKHYDPTDSKTRAILSIYKY